MRATERQRGSGQQRPAWPGNAMNVLEIEDLRILLRSGNSEVALVDGVSLAVAPGSVVGLAGESGSGKTLTGLSAMGFLPDRSRATGVGALRRSGRLEDEHVASAADARPPGRRRVPGSDDVAAPDAQRRTSTHRARRGAPRAVGGTSARAGDRAAQVGAAPRPRARPVELSRTSSPGGCASASPSPVRSPADPSC